MAFNLATVPMNADVVERLHRYLATELERSRSAPYERPITVAEIYQDLAPYRSARSAIGVAINQDYEHALMRLLAGEEGRVRLEPGTARGELERELRSPNPNITLYRKYAACDVWVQPPPQHASAGDVSAARPRPAPHAAQPEPHDAEPWADAAVSTPQSAASGGRPAASDAADDLVERALTERRPGDDEGASPVERAPAPVGAGCAFCGATLPSGREIRFCPRCGADQRTRPCAACDEPLELDWQYCIRCGAKA